MSGLKTILENNLAVSEEMLEVANATTQNEDTTLKAAVNTLCEGYGKGGDIPPRCTNGYFHPNVAADGSWIKPVDWPNLEALPLSNNEAYYLCDRDLGLKALNLKITYSGTLTFERGHIENDSFIVDSSYTGSFSSGHYWATIFDDTMPKYIIIHVKASSSITAITLSAMNTTTILNTTHFTDNPLPIATNTLYTNASYYPILWRYAKLSKATTIPCTSYYLEKDCVLDWHSSSTTAFSAGGMYSNCNRLVEVKLTGNFGPYITNASSMFNACYSLSKLDIENFNTMITSKCTTLASMFSTCYSLQELDVSGWDVSGATAVNSMFANARNLTKITGLENFRLVKATAMDSMLANAWNLYQENGILDASKWFDGKSAVVTKMNSTFDNMRSIKKIIIDGFDMSGCTTIANIFSNCYALEEIQGDIVPTSNKVTTIASLFVNDYTLSRINLTKLNAPNATTITSIYNYCYGLRSINISDLVETLPSVASNYDSIFRYCYMAENVDASAIDLSTVTTTTYSNMFANMPQLVEVYPPTHIGKAMTFSGSLFLSHDSLIRILNNLDTVSGSPTLTFSGVNLAKLTDEEKAIATDKGWKLA